MSHDHPDSAEAARSGSPEHLDPHYLGFFRCFNQQQYYEAHEVLEKLWLEQRKDVNGSFYKGLIQLAGAFVHLKKQHPQPAARLLQSALDNLRQYPPTYHQLDLLQVRKLVEEWLERLNSARPMREGKAGWEPPLLPLGD